MKLVYIDASAGLSGETLLGALLQAVGWDDARLQEELAQNPWSKWMQLTLTAHKRDDVNGLAVSAHCVVSRNEVPQEYAQICEILQHSRLSQQARQYALCTVQRYFAARAKLAATPLEKVQLSREDQIALCLATWVALVLAEMAPVRVLCSQVGVGCVQDGGFDALSPLVAQLLCERPICAGAGVGCTPAAAAAVAAMADAFGPIPPLTAQAIGYGFQDGVPHAARVFVGESVQQAQNVILHEANLDDMTGEALGFALQRVLEAGALDAWTEPIYMKKNRPAVKLCALGRAGDARVVQAMLAHTTTLGVRSCEMTRTVLPRRLETVRTPFGGIDVKLAQREGSTTVKPEYDCVSAAALAHGVSYDKVYRAALDAAKDGQWIRRGEDCIWQK